MKRPSPPSLLLRKIVQKLGLHPDDPEPIAVDLAGRKALIVATNHGMLDIGKPTGVFVVGVLRVFLQPEWVETMAGANTVLANLVGVVFGVFMYFPTLVEVPIAKMFLSLGMHPGPLIAYLMADPELSLQSILITTAIIGKLKAWTYVGLVALFATLAGLAYGAWVDGTSLLLLALLVVGFVTLLVSVLHFFSRAVQVPAH